MNEQQEVRRPDATCVGFREGGRIGSCVRCGRALKDPASLAAGMGPTCASKASRSDSGSLLNDQPVLNDVAPLLEVGLVCRRLADGRAACNLPHLIVHHSPTGFEWGYGGSGPADLALNVLHMLLPHKPVAGAEWYGVSDDAWRLHQPFKWAFIANMPMRGGRVTLEDMRAWIASKLVAEAA